MEPRYNVSLTRVALRKRMSTCPLEWRGVQVVVGSFLTAATSNQSIRWKQEFCADTAAKAISRARRCTATQYHNRPATTGARVPTTSPFPITHPKRVRPSRTQHLQFRDSFFIMSSRRPSSFLCATVQNNRKAVRRVNGFLDFGPANKFARLAVSHDRSHHCPRPPTCRVRSHPGKR